MRFAAYDYTCGQPQLTWLGALDATVIWRWSFSTVIYRCFRELQTAVIWRLPPATVIYRCFLPSGRECSASAIHAAPHEGKRRART